MEFDEMNFVGRTAQVEGGFKDSQRRAFLEFLKGWVENYDQSLAERFCLTFSRPAEHHVSVMEQCIHFATGRKVKMLHLDFSDPKWDGAESVENHETFLKLPLYDGHEGLESLKLYSCNLPVITKFKTFFALKSISLGWIRLTSSAVKNLLLKSPALEFLSFMKCWNVGYFDVTAAPSLKTLIIDKCFPPRPDMVLVNAPKLQSFKYSGALTAFQFERSYALEEADLDFGLEEEIYPSGNSADMLYNLLVEISHVKRLSVCSFMLQAIPNGEEPYSLNPALGCLRQLILKTALSTNEFKGISFFLRSCPNLETLTIDLCPARIYPFEEDEEIQYHNNPPGDILYFAFLDTSLQRLRSIVVKGFKGEPNELVVLQCFLKLGRVLETLSISIWKEPGHSGTSFEAVYRQRAQSLLLVQTASRWLKLNVSP